MSDDYLEVNRQSWDQRSIRHFDSDFYDNDSFIEGRNSLNSIEMDLLGDLRGKSVLHLQCHFGQDSISMARLGAEVTAVDFSSRAITLGKSLQEKVGTNVNFVEADVYSLPGKGLGTFDIVFTSYGTIGWLPDLERWAEVVNTHLKPGGRFIMADFHPVVWMFDDSFSSIRYSYFKQDAIIEEEASYTENSKDLSVKSISWNHSLSELLDSLLSQKLRLQVFREHDYSPYPCFDPLKEISPGKFQVIGLEGKLPMVYSLVAEKTLK